MTCRANIIHTSILFISTVYQIHWKTVPYELSQLLKKMLAFFCFSLWCFKTHWHQFFVACELWLVGSIVEHLSVCWLVLLICNRQILYLCLYLYFSAHCLHLQWNHLWGTQVPVDSSPHLSLTEIFGSFFFCLFLSSCKSCQSWENYFQLYYSL